MPDNLFRSHSLEKSSNEGKVVTSGALTLWEDQPVSPLDVGDTFQPVPNGPILTVKRVNIDDNVIGLNAGQPVRQWQISIEGSDEIDSSASERHSFSIEQDDDNTIHSGSISKVVTSNTPPRSISVGSYINIPGIGRIKCSKISGNDDFNEYGQRVWHLTYEGSDAPQSSSSDEDEDPLPKTKYSFSIDNEHSGSMQVVNEGDNPDVTLSIGSIFRIPGIGDVTCSKISGSDDYSQDGTRRWTVTYEGCSKSEVEETEDTNTRYSFSCDYDSGVRSGSMQVTYFGDAPSLELHEGDTFSIPCAGTLTCTKASGSDEYTSDGRHKWTFTYEGSNSASAVDRAKYSFSEEGNSDGVPVMSGTKQYHPTVFPNGTVANPDVAVGDPFTLPWGTGFIRLTCTKVSGNLDDSGVWTYTIEGQSADESFNLGDSGSGDSSSLHAKYTFTISNSGMSGSLEVYSTGDNPDLAYAVGSKIKIPGIDEKLTCTKVSGSDSYDDNGQRKWTLVYEVSNSDGAKYSFSREENSDGIEVTSGTKQYHPSVSSNGGVEGPEADIGEDFYMPYGEGRICFKCTKVSGNLDDSGVWTYTLEGQSAEDSSGSGDTGSGGSGSGGSGSSLPDSEASTSYEINGLTVRTVDGNLVALRRSETPISKTTITVYNSSKSKLCTPGDTFNTSNLSLPDGADIGVSSGGIVLSENVTKETIKSNGEIIKTYYKHSIEVEA